MPYTEQELRQAERRAFLEKRQQGIGGSDVAPILGLSKWSTPLDVYLSKVDPVDADEDVPEHLYWGNIHEETIAREFQRRSGLSVQRRNKMYVDGPRIANIDRYVTGERAILECKTAGEYMKSEWGESGSDEVPEAYICQCLHYMSVTGYKKCYLAVLIGGNKFRWYNIPYRERLANHLRDRCVSFWTDYVEPRIAPPPVNTDDLLALYGAGGLSPIEANEDVLKVVEALKTTKEIEKTAKDGRAELEFKIKAYLGEHDALVDPDTGDILATYKGNESRRFDTKGFKAAEPILYNEYAKATTSRRFLLK